MEYVDGVPLRSLRDGTAMPLAIALAIYTAYCAIVFGLAARR